MKTQLTTFIDVASGKPIGDPIEALIVPTFPGMIVENNFGIRYKVETAELMDFVESLRLFVNVRRIPA